MKSTVVAFLASVLLVVGSIAQAWAYYAVLPDRVASHFDAAGAADGWQSKGAFLLTHLGLVLGMASVLLPLVHLLVRFGPASMIGMPNRDYWFAEAREYATRVSIGDYVAWAINLSLALIAAQMEAIYRANVSGMANLGTWLWGSLAGYLLAMAVWGVSFYRRFRMPAEDCDPVDGDADR